MISFELKKLIRQRLILLVVIFSMLLSSGMYIFYRNRKINDSEFNVSQEMYVMSGYFSKLELPNKLNPHLTKEKIAEIMEKKDKLQSNYWNIRTWEIDKNNKHKSTRKFLKDYHDFIIKLEELRKEYKIVLDKETKNDWEWLQFEIDYQVKNDLNYLGFDYSSVSNNPIRVILSTSDILFGFPAILFLIFIFSSIVSKEKEKESINLLMTQPLSRFKIVFSKWLMIILMGILYALCTLIFSLIIYKLSGLDWFNGHLEIYRVFGKNNLEYVVAYKLLVKIILSFIAMVMFFATLIILVSSKVKDSKLSVVTLICFIIILGINTNIFEFLKTVYNPIYVLSTKGILNGYYTVEYVRELQKTVYVYYTAKYITPYIIYIILSFILLPLSLVLLRIKNSVRKKVFSRSINSIFKFELIKIVREDSFKLLIFTTILLLAISSFKIYLNDLHAPVDFGDIYYSMQSSEEFSKKYNVENRKEEYLNAYGNLDNYYKDIEYHDKKIKKYKEAYKNSENKYDYYKNNDYEKYYSLAIDDLESEKIYHGEEEVSVPCANTKDHSYTIPSFLESEAIYKYLKENKIKTVKMESKLFMSDYEKLNKKAMLIGEDSVAEHSISYILRRYINSYPLEVLLLLIISFITLGGYAYDTEKGNQIELMYTNPINKNEYYKNKFLSTYFVSSTVFLMIISSLFLISLLSLGGIGDFRFPIIHYDKIIEAFQFSTKEYFHIIPIWRYNLRFILVFILQLGFISSLGILISMYFKDRIKVFLATFGCISLGVFLSKLLPKYINMLSPFNHLQASKIANGAIKMKYNMPYHNIWISVFVLIISTVLIGYIGCKLNKNKEVI